MQAKDLGLTRLGPRGDTEPSTLFPKKTIEEENPTILTTITNDEIPI